MKRGKGEVWMKDEGIRIKVYMFVGFLFVA